MCAVCYSARPRKSNRAAKPWWRWQRRQFRIKKEFLDHIASHSTHEAIAGLRKALLNFHSPHDIIVDIENAAQIFIAAKHPKSFVSLDDAQRVKLLAIANKCPVHRTLHSEVFIPTRLKDTAAMLVSPPQDSAQE